jgi:hypothetical protein
MTLYIEIVDADKYFTVRPFANDWLEASDEDKLSCLTLAQKHIDSLPLVGRKLIYLQENQFPRYYVSKNVNEDFEFVYNVSTIPQEVKDAVCEEAFAIFKYMDKERFALREQGVATASRGGLAESYETYRPLGELLSAEAKRLIQNWVVGNPVI